MTQFTNLAILTPEIFLTTSILVILLTGVFVQKADKLMHTLTQISLLILVWLIWRDSGQSLMFSTSSEFFRITPFISLLKGIIVVNVWLISLLAKRYLRVKKIPVLEFNVLMLSSLLGMMVLVSAYNLIVFFLALELMTLPTYALVAIERDNILCTEAALKYFITGMLASSIMLYGFSMFYGVLGALDMGVIFSHLQDLSAGTFTPILMGVEMAHILLSIGVVLVVIGLLFKLGAVPCHVWVPDVYEGAPTIVTLFIATAPKLAVFGVLITLVSQVFQNLMTEWVMLLSWGALGSIFFGNVVAIMQSNIKRMLAYSSIAHMGYMLLGFIVFNQHGYVAAMFYLLAYVLTTYMTFGTLVAFTQEKSELNLLADFSGLNKRHPWYAFWMLVAMLSFTGMPPIVGFVAKLSILKVLVDVNAVSYAIFAILLAVVGAFYYLRVVKIAYFDDESIVSKPDSGLQLVWSEKLALSIAVLLVLGVGIYPSSLIWLCEHVLM